MYDGCLILISYVRVKAAHNEAKRVAVVKVLLEFLEGVASIEDVTTKLNELL